MRVWGASLAVAVVGLAAFAAPASATTFCIPGFFDACPNNGTNVVRNGPDALSSAMSDDGNDDIPDRVVINAGTFTQNGSIDANGLDPLEVVGAGTKETRITSNVDGNEYVALLDDRPGMKMSDLTIVGPVTLGDRSGGGAIAQLKNATLTDVDVEVNSEDADGLALIGNCVITRSHLEGGEGFRIDKAIRLNSSSAGHSVVIGAEIVRPVYGFEAMAEDARLDVILSHVDDPSAAGAWIGHGARMLFQNSVMATAGQRAFVVDTDANFPDDTRLVVDSSTIFNVGTSYEPALNVDVASSVTAGDGFVDVSGSIIRGYDHTWDMSVPIGPGFPGANLKIDHSNFAPTSPEGSSGNPDVDDPTNINEDPLFTSPQDLRLLPGSPSIDKGNPASLLTIDFEAAPRPRDGDGNGSSLPDQGAFEFQPTCETVPATCPKETTPPRVSKVKVRFKRGKGGLLRFRLSENATVKAVFTPVPKKSRKVVKVTRRGKQGLNKIKLLKRKLKPGKYRVAITATDLAGNRSKVLKKKFRAT